MQGTLTDGYPVIDIPIPLPGMPTLSLSFVIDTGFAGFLTLPEQAVTVMKLPFFYQMPARLADGSRTMAAVHLVTIRWHNELREVEVLALGERPLLGRALLTGSRLTVDFVLDGELTITQHEVK